jgi:hypothetical protein
MKYTILILLALTVIACSEPKQRRVYACDCKQMAEVSKNIKESIGKVNNMSDEEMEDVIIQLERTFVRTNCSQRMVDGLQHDVWFEITAKDTIYTYFWY